jgi:hypothetical protein
MEPALDLEGEDVAAPAVLDGFMDIVLNATSLTDRRLVRVEDWSI